MWVLGGRTMASPPSLGRPVSCRMNAGSGSWLDAAYRGERSCGRPGEGGTSIAALLALPVPLDALLEALTVRCTAAELAAS